VVNPDKEYNFLLLCNRHFFDTFTFYDVQNKDIHTGYYLSLQNYSLPGLSLFESVLQVWVMCGKQTRCSRRFNAQVVPPGAPCYLGTTTVPDGHGGNV